MPEFFIIAHSNAAPFVSDRSTHFVEARTAEQALEGFAASYSHPCGLFSANAYDSADDYHRGMDPLAGWRSVRALEQSGKHGAVV